MEKEIIDLLSYVKLSKNREKTLLAMNDDILTYSEISKKIKILNDICRTLHGLKDQNLIKCLNKEKKR